MPGRLNPAQLPCARVPGDAATAFTGAQCPRSRRRHACMIAASGGEVPHQQVSTNRGQQSLPVQPQPPAMPRGGRAHLREEDGRALRDEQEVREHGVRRLKVVARHQRLQRVLDALQDLRGPGLRVVTCSRVSKGHDNFRFKGSSKGHARHPPPPCLALRMGACGAAAKHWGWACRRRRSACTCMNEWHRPRAAPRCSPAGGATKHSRTCIIHC